MKEEKQDICRICLETSVKTINVNEKLIIIDSVTSIRNVFLQISGYWIEDNEPQQLCHKCYNSLKLSYEFKIQYTLAQDQIANFTRKKGGFEVFISEIKEENLSLDEEDEATHLEPNISTKASSKKSRTLKKDQYLCTLCNKGFTYMRSFEGHLALKHEKEAKVSCSYCNENQFLEALDYHELQCKSDDALKSVNEGIKKTSKLPKPSIPPGSSCSYCETKNLNTKMKLLLHCRKFHKDKATIKCKFCDRLVCPEVVEYHLEKCSINRDKLTSQERVVCQYCGKSVKRCKVSIHKKTHEEQQPGPMYCDHCDYKGNSHQNMVNHMRNIHLKIPHKCKHCMAEFKNYSAVVSHLRKAHPDIYPAFKCDQCPFETTEKSTLNTHKKGHAGEIAKTNRCEMCGKGFVMLSKLKIHLQRHGDERNYSCEICGATFKTKKCLGRHRQIHISKDYKCTVCQSRYSTSLQLQYHVKKNHPSWAELAADAIFSQH